MAKFHGRVGFGETVETSPGVFADNIVEYSFYGDVIQNRRTLRQDESLNKDISVGNSISILANAFARGRFFDIRYVEWTGELWTVIDVEVQFPRLILRLGEVYNGPTASASVAP